MNKLTAAPAVALAWCGFVIPNETDPVMQIQSAIPAARSSARPSLIRVLAAVRATLHTWRERARERAELATMDARERHDLPHVRDFDIHNEMAKPFWRE